MCSKRLDTPYPVDEPSAICVRCPRPECVAQIWVGSSQMRRRHKRRETGCIGEASCGKCGCRITVDVSGEGKITVLEETPVATPTSPKLSAPQVRVMRWLSHGWEAEPGGGSVILVNGQRVCNTDTIMALYRAGFATRGDRGCWRATPAGLALRDRLPKD